MSPSIRAWIDLFFVRNIAPRHLHDVWASYVQALMDEKKFKQIATNVFNTPFTWIYFATQTPDIGVFNLAFGFKKIIR